MPWTAADAKRFTKRANTAKKAKQWAAIANSVLSRCLAAGGSQKTCEGRAITQANGSIRESRVTEAVWSRAYINRLPDSCFAYIEPGGKKDDEGKTVPRDKRHLPYKDANGKPSKAHIRNALARLPQTQIPPAAKKRAAAKLRAAARGTDIEVSKEGGTVTKTGTHIQEAMTLDLGSALVDKEGSAIRNLRILNRERKTGKRTYSNRALEDVARLVEGRRSYADHSDEAKGRSIRDLIGMWGGGRADVREGFVTADLAVLPNQRWLLDIAEKMPKAVAMSIDAEAMVSRKAGKETVHGVTRLNSVDVVTEGGTTHGLFESEEGGEEMTIESLADLKAQHSGLLEEFRTEVEAEVSASTDAEAKTVALEAKLREATERQKKAEKIAEELQTEKKLREKAEAIDKAIAEAKLPEEAVTPIWRKSLSGLDEAELKEAIEDRKKLVETTIKSGRRPVSQERKLEQDKEMKPQDLREALID